jgi:hypothetical protein
VLSVKVKGEGKMVELFVGFFFFFNQKSVG